MWRPCTLACQPTHDCQNGGLRVERAHCHGIFGLSDYHQERTSPTYSQRKNNLRQSTPNDHVTSQIEHGDDVMSTVDVLWVVALAFPNGGGV